MFEGGRVRGVTAFFACGVARSGVIVVCGSWRVDWIVSLRTEFVGLWGFCVFLFGI